MNRGAVVAGLVAVGIVATLVASRTTRGPAASAPTPVAGVAQAAAPAPPPLRTVHAQPPALPSARPQAVALSPREHMLRALTRDRLVGPYLLAAQELELAPEKREAVVALLRGAQAQALLDDEPDPARQRAQLLDRLTPALRTLVGPTDTRRILEGASRHASIAAARDPRSRRLPPR